MTRASTGMLEKGTPTPSPSPDLIPAKNRPRDGSIKSEIVSMEGATKQNGKCANQRLSQPRGSPHLDVPVVCQFIKPKYSKQQGNNAGEILEIFFSHEPDIRGHHILLVEGLVHSGLTSEFLMNDLRARGAASVKLCTLLDRQSARRVALQPDYFGFLVDEAFLVGYGLGAVEQTNRNLSYLAAN